MQSARRFSRVCSAKYLIYTLSYLRLSIVNYGLRLTQQVRIVCIDELRVVIIFLYKSIHH